MLARPNGAVKMAVRAEPTLFTLYCQTIAQ